MCTSLREMGGDPAKGSVPSEFKGLSGILALAAAQPHTWDSPLLDELQGVALTGNGISLVPHAVLCV